jgi:hypothetical protein
VEVWRDISLIWLISMAIVSVLPFAIAGFFAIKGMHELRRFVKRIAPVAQDKAHMVAVKSDEVSQKVAKPFLVAYGRAAQAQTMTRAITRRTET